jgi:hemerythrin
MSIQWREEMTIDHGPIDQDHRTLIAIINEFCDTAATVAALPRLRATLDKLHHYTEVHFQREEALQARAQYPYLDAHHHEHLDLIRQLARIREQLAQLTAPTEDSTDGPRAETPTGSSEQKKRATDVAAIHANVVAFVHDWLIDHIIKSDLRMKPYAAKMAHHARQMAPLDPSAV